MIERKPFIAGNWKMNLGVEESISLAKAISAAMNDLEGVDVMVAPPFTLMGAVREALSGSGVFLGAQNMHWELGGAYTGEVSVKMLKEAGCTHVILGHSERRTLFGETSEIVDLKMKTAALIGLIPILCIGETLEEREAGETFDVIRNQLSVSLRNFSADGVMLPSTIIAYEPVWAIGTGRSATSEQAQEVHQFIRKWIEENFNLGTANQVRILYGGSVTPENVDDLMSQADIDGALVGGASLKADSFVPIMGFQ